MEQPVHPEVREAEVRVRSSEEPEKAETVLPELALAVAVVEVEKAVEPSRRETPLPMVAGEENPEHSLDAVVALEIREGRGQAMEVLQAEPEQEGLLSLLSEGRYLEQAPSLQTASTQPTRVGILVVELQVVDLLRFSTVQTPAPSHLQQREARALYPRRLEVEATARRASSRLVRIKLSLG